MNTPPNTTTAQVNSKQPRQRELTSEKLRPEKRAPESWLADQLRNVFEGLAQEPLPPELLTLAEQLGARRKS